MKKHARNCVLFHLYRMHNVKYDYSSCHIDVPQSLANEIVKWGRKEVSDDEIFVTQRDPTFGREDEIHITILYGIHSESSEGVREVIKDFGPVSVEFGKVDIFTSPLKFDVVMIEVHSDDLCRLNEKLQKSIKFTNKYPSYKPHATIAYVKKGKGWKHQGLSKWNGTEFTSDFAVFSSKNGTKERIAL
jgi:2'-5' RNA ligase